MTDAITQKVELFFSAYRLKAYEKGQILIHNGEKSKDLFFIIKGKVKEYDVNSRGDEVIVNIFRHPAYFPLSHAFDKTINRFIFEAETDIEVRQAPIEAVFEFLKANPDVMMSLLERIYAGIDGVLGRMAHLMSSNASNRLVFEIILEAKRFGTPGKNGVIDIHINEKDLGARAGLSRETISREINKLKAKKIISIENKLIKINNLDELQKSLDEDF